MVWDIALGILLGYILIGCLPLIIGGGILLIGLAIAAAIVIAAIALFANNPAFFGLLIFCTFVTFILVAAKDMLKKDYQPIASLTGVWNGFLSVTFLVSLLFFSASFSNLLHGDTR